MNGHREMAYAFMEAGFLAVDVHMSDIIAGRATLASFVGMAVPGGFSYGDVLGAGQGWSKSALFHEAVRSDFKNFFQRVDTFTLGVCNGCQFLSRMKELIPGASSWPTFERNISERYEARVCMVSLADETVGSNMSPSVFLTGLNGAKLPVVVAHGEGRAVFNDHAVGGNAGPAGDATGRFVDSGLAAVRVSEGLLQADGSHADQPNSMWTTNPCCQPHNIHSTRTGLLRVLRVYEVTTVEYSP